MTHYRSEGGWGGGRSRVKKHNRVMRGPTIGSSPWCGRWVATGHGTTAREEGGGGVARPAQAKKKGKEERGAGPVGRLGGMG
jgi:hypothetical protein